MKFIFFYKHIDRDRETGYCPERDSDAPESRREKERRDRREEEER